MTALSCIAYAAWVFLAAFFFRDRCLPPAGKNARMTGEKTASVRPVRGIGALCLAMGAFFFVPPGSLPPFYNISWGGAMFLGCLGCAALFTGSRACVFPLVIITCITVVFFCYARQRGMPGSAANLGTFTGMPVWGIASLRHLFGFAALALGFLPAARMFFSATAAFSPGHSFHGSVGAAAQCLAVCALFVSLFAPWNTAPYLSLPDAVVAGEDFLLFWGKAVSLAAALCRCPPVPAKGRIPAVACCVTGSILIGLTEN